MAHIIGEECIGCGKVIVANNQNCMGCQLCSTECPLNAINMEVEA